MKLSKNDRNDPRSPIWKRLYACLTKNSFRVGNSSFPFSGDAWNTCSIAGLDSPEVNRSLQKLLEHTKRGREREMILICAELGRFWLDAPENSRHLCRADVQKSVDGLTAIANRYVEIFAIEV